MQVAQYLEALGKLKDRLLEIKNEEDKGDINFFSIVGMKAQEIKHSAFFSWLLSSDGSHDLNSKILEKVCNKLYDYQVQHSTSYHIETNEKIIKKSTKCLNKQAFLKLVSGLKNEVHTEVVTVEDKRIDILIDIPETKTFIVIENKVFTKSHDNQLVNYQNYVNGCASGFHDYLNKIYIYLSPEGEIPINYGGNERYNPLWCVFDYRKIVDIVNEVLKELNEKQQLKRKKDLKLKNILEDYEVMIKTNLLMENPNILNECKEILDDKQLREAFELLTLYTQTATEDKVLSFVRSYLNAVEDGAKSQRWFYTLPMKKFFEREGEKINNHLCRCVCQPIGAMSGIVGFEIVISLEKRNGAWTKAQEKILKKIQPNKNWQDKTFVSPPNSRIVLLTGSEQGQLFEQIKPNLENQLKKFQIILSNFENQLEEL